MKSIIALALHCCFFLSSFTLCMKQDGQVHLSNKEIYKARYDKKTRYKKLYSPKEQSHIQKKTDTPDQKAPQQRK